MVNPLDGIVLAQILAVAGAAIALFFYLLPVLQRQMNLKQFVVYRLHRRAQRAMHLAHAADQALVAYERVKAEDQSMPHSLVPGVK